MLPTGVFVMFVFHHVSLSVTNMDRSIAFYNTFGFKDVLRWNDDDGTLAITHLKLNGFYLELFCYADSKPAPDSMSMLETDLKVVGTRHFGLKVQSIDEARRLFIEKGMAKTIEIKKGKTGIDYFFIKDPDGIFVEVVQDDRNL
jgi:glyoxylase I family protein